MANSFYKTVKKISDFFGLGKVIKRITGMSDEEYKEVNDYIDNHNDEDIDAIIGTNSAGKQALKIKKIIEPIVNVPTSIAEWGKEQIEASSGATANKTNKKIAEQNLDFEREKFDYDKALQQQIFQREDTANQRTVNDMRMAGLNPLNMKGTNGAGQIVSTTAPNNDFQMQSTQGLQIMDQIFNTALSAKATASNNSLQQANANLLNAQAENQRIKNMYESDILSASIVGNRYDNQKKYMENVNSQNNYFFNRIMGWTENMPDWMKQSSARFGWRPFDDNFTYSEFNKGMKDPYGVYFRDHYNPSFYGNKEISQNLLSDELLQGTLGIFGNVLKLLFK